jgi:hypothetical protein
MGIFYYQKTFELQKEFIDNPESIIKECLNFLKDERD